VPIAAAGAGSGDPVPGGPGADPGVFQSALMVALGKSPEAAGGSGPLTPAGPAEVLPAALGLPGADAPQPAARPAVLAPTSGGWWIPTTLHEFDSTDGAFPQSTPLLDAVGNLYGTTVSGGASNSGVVFEIQP